MVFPIGDDQVRGGHPPLVAYAFIAINVVFFLYQFTQPGALVCEWGAIPAEIANGEDYITLFTSMFMHGGWMHLIGNMLFLWVFGDNIEATIGSVPFAIFYILGGLAAHLAHIVLGTGGEMIAGCCNPCLNSAIASCEGQVTAMCPGTIPTVGASGAIAAVLGAYLVMFPKSQIKILVLIFMRSFRVAAILFLGFWIGQQLISGMGSLSGAPSGGVAWWAHIGGFAFGLLSGVLFRLWYSIPPLGNTGNRPF